MRDKFDDVGVVLIGRNEGARLVRCLESTRVALGGSLRRVVYVDSASSDDSLEQAKSRGAHTVSLDMSKPFSAARARNEGWRALHKIYPKVAFVHFFDGDCEVPSSWIAHAVAAIRTDAKIASVCGYRREKYPDGSVFNRICDVEWRAGPVGETPDFGGDVLLRISALVKLDGYRDEVIAGEEPELAIRLRSKGFRLLRLNETSSLHDAEMKKISQWWTRQLRAGHAFAQVEQLHPEASHFAAALKRAVAWGAMLPAVAIGAAPLTLGASLGLGAVYPVQALRIARATHARGYSWEESLAWGFSCSFGKVPEALGVMRFWHKRARGIAPSIIEYK